MTQQPNSAAGRKRDAMMRTANGAFQAWQDRTDLVKQERAATNAANDAKTARLKALRLEKEEQDARDAAAVKAAAPPALKKKPAKRTSAE
ncbi:MAG: hypothetical protein JWP16_1100 [Alphaproteobacteria bacterium]|jgi:hypothetical protein|nr:hypothetical protein [Alphaproteobacteria bacterium]